MPFPGCPYPVLPYTKSSVNEAGPQDQLISAEGLRKFNRQVSSMPAGGTLRIQAAAPFQLHWTRNEWQQADDTRSTPTGLENHQFVDVQVSPGQRAPIRFTFFWTTAGHWEGRDFQVGIGGARPTRGWRASRQRRTGGGQNPDFPKPPREGSPFPWGTDRPRVEVIRAFRLREGR